MQKALMFFLVVCAVSITARPQVRNYTKRPAVGIHMLLYDYTDADSLRLKTGIAVSFQNQFTYRWIYGAALEGAFVEKEGKRDGKKEMLLQADLFVRWKLTKPGTIFQPFLQAGAGFSKFNVYYGAYASAGPGIQVNLSENLFLLANAQYRLPVTSDQPRHLCFSIGLAGPIYRKRVSTQAKKVLPPPPALVPRTDTDGDGLPDSTDACPTVAGAANLRGCPEPVVARVAEDPPVNKDAIQTALNTAAQNIFFKTASYILLPESLPALEQVLKILQEHPGWKLNIEGHTDNTGTPHGNQELSAHRARAVSQFLQSRGVEASRLQSAGFGATRPIAANTTTEGKAKNRRVELKLQF